MSTNISVSGSAQTTITIPDAEAYQGKHLFRFFSDGKPVFNKATPEYGGKENEVIVNAGVNYQVPMEPALANLLKINPSYQHFGEKSILPAGAPEGASEELVFELIGDGNITLNDPADTSVSSAAIAYTNASRQSLVSASVYTATAGDDTIVIKSDCTVKMPDHSKMLGKEIRIKVDGEYDVIINDKNDAEIITINAPGGSIRLEASATKWLIFPFSNP